MTVSDGKMHPQPRQSPSGAETPSGATPGRRPDVVSIVTALSHPDNPSEHPPPRDKGGPCTCHWPPNRYAGPGFGLDPDCPRHGTDACLALADPTLDIDTSYQGEEA